MLVSLISTSYQIACVPPPTIWFRRKVLLSNSAWPATSDKAVSIVSFSRRCPPAILAGITYVEKKLLKHLSEKLPHMYKCTLVNDVKENAKSSFCFYLISCIHIVFIKMEKQELQFFLVITVLRKLFQFTM